MKQEHINPRVADTPLGVWYNHNVLSAATIIAFRARPTCLSSSGHDDRHRLFSRLRLYGIVRLAVRETPSPSLEVVRVRRVGPAFAVRTATAAVAVSLAASPHAVGRRVRFHWYPSALGCRASGLQVGVGASR